MLSALKTGIEELNAEAFKRLIKALKADEAAAAALRKAVRDPLVYQVLLFHGIVKEPLEHRVARALEAVRPALKQHGGDVAQQTAHAEQQQETFKKQHGRTVAGEA